MDKQNIIETIRAEKAVLQSQFGVEEIGLFGSYARDMQAETSDVDILVNMKDRSMTNYFNLLDFLEAKLRAKIDLVAKHPNLSDSFLKMISKDIVYV